MKTTLNYLLILSLILPFAFTKAEAQNLKLSKFVIGGGGMVNEYGDTGAGTNNLALSGTYAQTAIGKRTTTGMIDGQRYDLYQGFWLPDFLTGTSVEEPWKNQNALSNYPNPFSNFTTIQYELPAPAFISLKIYDITGVEVALLINNEYADSGVNTIEWNAKNKIGIDVSSGNYLYELTVKPASMAGGGAFNPYTIRNVMMVTK